MTQRALHVVAYDVSHPRRLRLALHAVRGHASGGQKSVHECFLSPAEKVGLMRRLRAVLDGRSDGVIAVRLDPRSRPRCLGVARPPADGRFLFIG